MKGRASRGRAAAFNRAVGVVLIVMAVLVGAGWILSLDPLRAVLSDGVAMNPLSAICFALLGVALLAPDRPRVVAGVALAIGTAAGIRLLAYLGGPDLGLDRLLFADALASFDPPNRMAPSSAAGFALSALAVFLVGRRSERVIVAGQAAALTTGIIGLIATTGYAFGLADAMGLRTFIPMPFNTGLGFAIASTGILMSRSDAGLVREASAATPGGMTFRRIAPVAVLLPPVLSWLAIHGVRNGLLSAGVAVSLAVIAGTLLLIALLTGNARMLNRLEAARLAGDARTRSLLRELQRKSAELTAANAELEAFSYSVSHDLRAPLRSVTSFSQILLDDHAAQLDEQGRDYLARIVRGGTRMSTLIDDLIELARVSRGELVRGDVKVSEVARDVIEEIELGDPARTVDVQVEPGLEAFADPRLVRVVLANLIGNAWKYTGRTDAPSLRFGALPRAGGNGTNPAAAAGSGEQGSVAVVDAGPAVFFVRDNGVGFDMQYADRLFTPFQRLHRREEFPGTGIGLATVRRIINRHGGRIWAEATPGAGATFYFTLNPGGES